MRRFLFLLLLLPLLLLAGTMAQPLQAAVSAKSGLERVTAAKLVRVCIWPYYCGISYRNPKTQQLSGIDIDMANELGKDLDVAVEFVDSPFSRLIDDVSGERCDVATFAIGITLLRAQKLRFTRPHLVSDIYAITSRTNAMAA